MNVDILTITSLHLELFFDDKRLSYATGFVVKKDDHCYLVTNWHVVSGRNPKTNKTLSPTGAIPNRIVIWHNQKDKLGSWIALAYPLQDKDGIPLWKETSVENEKNDVVILPFEDSANISIYPLDLNLKDIDLVISPSEDVTIVGFPYGKASAESSLNGKIENFLSIIIFTN